MAPRAGLDFNPLNADLNSIYHFLALLGAHPILHISGVRVNRTPVIFMILWSFFVMMNITRPASDVLY